MKIKLETVFDAIEMADDAFTYFYDTGTGKVLLLSDLNSEEENEAAADAIESEPERYLRLPTKYEIHEYRIMEAFAEAYPNDRVRRELCSAILGRGAFRRFKNAIRYYGAEQEWYDWRDQAYREIAVGWCKEHGLEYTESSCR